MKAPEVKALVDTLTERVDNIIRTLDELKAEHKQTVKSLNDHRLELEKVIALLKRDVEELQKGRDVWGNRTFMAILAVFSAVFGALITYSIKKP